MGRAWKMRYCELYSDGRFKYYEDETRKNELGNTLISNITNVTLRGDSFLVETPERNWKFETTDAMEALNWKRKFQKLKRGGNVHKGQQIRHQGWLTKQGHHVKNWKQRYCVLNFKYC